MTHLKAPEGLPVPLFVSPSAGKHHEVRDENFPAHGGSFRTMVFVLPAVHFTSAIFRVKR
jgi:hypothetical protein